MKDFILGTASLFNKKYSITSNQSHINLQLFFDQSYDIGFKEIDTAQNYGFGSADSTISKLSIKNKFLINTKFNFNYENFDYNINQIQSSLKLLDAINICFIHNTDFNNKNFERSLINLNNLKLDNLFKKFGVSIYDEDEYKKSNENTYIDVIQIPLNLFNTIELLENSKKKIQARSIFFRNVFINNNSEYSKEINIYLNKITKLINEENLNFYEASLLFIKKIKFVDSIIIGSRNINNLKIIDTKKIMSDKLFNNLYDISQEKKIWTDLRKL